MADLSTETTVRTQRKEDKGKADTYIIGIFITLCIFSIIESYSASSREIYLSGKNESFFLRSRAVPYHRLLKEQ